MAITKTSQLTSVTVQVTGARFMDQEDDNPWISCQYTDTIDDPDDDSLPITQRRGKQFSSGDDVTGEPQIVQDIAAAIWA